ncbi:MAG TPA: substrate-binding domain-containing protein [Opitutaceae bacterium]|nr:substrate-binding domain-containing protein [Opitutaceae bacterium]
MTRNNVLLVGILAAVGAALTAIKLVQRHPGPSHLEPIVLYEPLPHPYCTAVGEGGTAFSHDSGLGVRVVVGQESTQANVNTNIESMFTVGYRAFSIYPVDPAGTKGLFARLRRAGCLVVAYGAQPEKGTDTPFAVATDTRQAATLAAEKLVALMHYHGRILNVLESLTDANTPIRRAAIEAVVARYPGVKITQTVGDVTTEQEAREKVESALVARGDDVDGVICTGYTTTVAAAVLISQHNRQPGAKRIHFVGLDTDDRVLAAIRDGSIDMTLAQNPHGHGYISCALLALMLEGWKPRAPYQFIDSGCVPVTGANLDTFQSDIDRMTRSIVAELKTKYLLPPGDGTAAPVTR